MPAGDRLIVESVYVSWEAGDLPAMLRCFANDIKFAVHHSGVATFIGEGQGKAQLAERLGRFLLEYDVVDYGTTQIYENDGVVDCRVRYEYRHRMTGMEIDGTMRHIWRVVDGKIVSFEVIHDAQRMSAFFELAARACSSA
ncbi:MAG: nuclear transport factor 2 family protein [Hyphomicrobiaceae bacterium]|nr:MAG: nuclear transport factor 2 family protein [Hyphomicrobiaceae bacterium]